MLNPGNIHYELSDRRHGGMGAVQMLVKRLELDEAINRRLHLFKLHNPYFGSDHVLNIAYNILCNGQCLEDIERLRNDQAYLNAVCADRIPDPTTAGDFRRRFAVEHVEILQDVINEIRLKVCRQQGPEFFTEAVIDADGTIAGKTRDSPTATYFYLTGVDYLVNLLACPASSVARLVSCDVCLQRKVSSVSLLVRLGTPYGGTLTPERKEENYAVYVKSSKVY